MLKINEFDLNGKLITCTILVFSLILWGLIGFIVSAILLLNCRNVMFFLNRIGESFKTLVKVLFDVAMALSFLIATNQMLYDAVTLVTVSAFFFFLYYVGFYRNANATPSEYSSNKIYYSATSALMAILALGFLFEILNFSWLNYSQNIGLIISHQLLVLLLCVAVVPCRLLLLSFLDTSGVLKPVGEQYAKRGAILFFAGTSNGELKAYKYLLALEGIAIELFVSETENKDKYIEGVLAIPLSKFEKIASNFKDRTAILLTDKGDLSDGGNKFSILCAQHQLVTMTLQNLATNRVSTTLSEKALSTSWSGLLLTEKSQEASRNPEVKSDLGTVSTIDPSRAVIVTGGAGSIGKAVVETLISLNYDKIHVLEISEIGLYTLGELHPELVSSGRLSLHLCDIKNKATLEPLVLEINPAAVFHVAAYKHVHLSESNSDIVFQNNVEGSYNVLSACSGLQSLKQFTLVSTDKAVFPTNFMGATKRMAELLTCEFSKGSSANFSVVRFGNVMGSSGSALLKFAQQIRETETVTLTHIDMERYFMSIQEAAFLVVESSFNPMFPRKDNHQCYVLDMGKPKRIISVIENLVTLAGKKLVTGNWKNRDEVELKIVGLRPGEKLYEELSHSNDLIPSGNPLINQVEGGVDTQMTLTEEFKDVFKADKPKLDMYLTKFSDLRVASHEKS